ncbi:MAG TPA: nuclear transport factor 2 family protein, partial [Chitinophagaceae bacterium]|nr:nuclear transport factor 2 family protein [Chitinophagaceae bacterium]
GIHHFYATDNGEEKLVGQPKFMHIWKRQGKDWKIVRIVSYDH